jgi:hypothetical protein
MNDRRAGSQAAWALLTEGVTRARLEAHRIQHMIDRVMLMVEQSDHKEHIYQMAGDVIVGIPERLTNLQVALDRTGLALSKMGEDFLSSRLPISEKNLVEEAVAAAFGSGQPRHSESVQRVARRYIRERLTK